MVVGTQSTKTTTSNSHSNAYLIINGWGQNWGRETNKQQKSATTASDKYV